MNRPFIAFDTERARRRGAPHLLELGAVRVIDGEIEDTFDRLVRPEIEIEDDAIDVHGIDVGTIENAEPAAEVLMAFRDWAGDDWLAAHDAPQDAETLAFEAARAGISLPSSPILDTLALAKRYLPECRDHSLTGLCEFLGLEIDTHHRALPDAVACWKVAEACLDGLEPDALLAEWTRDVRRFSTFDAARPALPRLKQRLRKLNTALSQGAGVRLLYGSSPEEAVPLRVRPRFSYRRADHDFLEAECEKSGLLKTYRIDRIQKILA